MKTDCFFEMHKQILSSKILSFIRETVLKITKIQTFALVYFHIINKTAIDARHIILHSPLHMHPAFLHQNKLFTANRMWLNDKNDHLYFT